MSLEGLRLRRVLCALDVERAGVTALSLGSLLAERFHASVDALYASNPLVSFLGRADRVRRLITEHSAHDRLDGIVASLTRKVCVSSYITRGQPSAVILSHCERYRADLIVMASSPQQRFALGASTIGPVSKHAACAVLTVGSRFNPVAPRRILLPTGPQGVTQEASRWVATLASRFDAEVGLLRIEQRKSGFWQTNSSLPAVVEEAGASRADAATALADLRRGGIDAYEIEHPGGADCDALGELCESGAFDLVVMSVGAAGEGESRGRLLAAVRRQTSAPVLSVRAVRAPALFAPGHFERLPENNIDGLGLPA